MCAPWRGFDRVKFWQTCLAWNCTDPQGEGFWWDSGIDIHPITCWVSFNWAPVLVQRLGIREFLQVCRKIRVFSQTGKGTYWGIWDITQNLQNWNWVFQWIPFLFCIVINGCKASCMAMYNTCRQSFLQDTLKEMVCMAFHGFALSFLIMPCSSLPEPCSLLWFWLRGNFTLNSLKSLSSEAESCTGGFLRSSLDKFISEMRARWIWVIFLLQYCILHCMEDGEKVVVDHQLLPSLSAARSRRINFCQIH